MGSGYPEEDVIEEVDMMLEGGSGSTSTMDVQPES